MRQETPFYRLIRWLLVSAALGIILILGYTAIRLGTQPPLDQTIMLSPLPSVAASDWTPSAPIEQLDPAVITYLQYEQAVQGVAKLQVLGNGIIPVGAYLPDSGNSRLQIMTATSLPTDTATPVPTTTLIPVFQPTRTPLPSRTPLPTQPTPTPTSELVATVLAFAATVNAPTAIVISPTPTIFITAVVGAECAPSGLPVSGLLTQRYFIGHNGVDLAVPPGTPVRATHSGYIDSAEWNIYGYGNLVIVHSDHFITYYAHNSSFNVKKGEWVNKGAIIAFSGSTGHSSGPHVHYETRINDVTVDPLTFEYRGYHTC